MEPRVPRVPRLEEAGRSRAHPLTASDHLLQPTEGNGVEEVRSGQHREALDGSA